MQRSGCEKCGGELFAGFATAKDGDKNWSKEKYTGAATWSGIPKLISEEETL
jgi:predicted  nucleic acid-binding Zn-ribbon protein